MANDGMAYECEQWKGEEWAELLRLDVFRSRGAARLVRVARAHGTANAKIKCRTWIRVSPVDA